MKPRMFYFGPWDQAGHYFFAEGGRSTRIEDDPTFPFGHYGGKVEVDGRLQPGCPSSDDRLQRKTRPEVEGQALLHHIKGWSALCFWDRSVDKRGACNSNYFAEGIFSFEEMVAMAKERFAERWNKMPFKVVLIDTETANGSKP